MMSANTEASSRDAVDNSEDDDSEAAFAQSSVEALHDAKLAYRLENNSKKQLFLLCVGLKEAGVAIFDILLLLLLLLLW